MSDLDPYSVSNPYCVPDSAERERRLQEEFLRQRQAPQLSVNWATAELAKGLTVHQGIREPERAFRQAEEFFAYAEAWFASKAKK